MERARGWRGEPGARGGRRGREGPRVPGKARARGGAGGRQRGRLYSSGKAHGGGGRVAGTGRSPPAHSLSSSEPIGGAGAGGGEDAVCEPAAQGERALQAHPEVL